MTATAGIGHYRGMDSSERESGKPWWEPSRFAARRPALERRAELLRALRGFFAARGYVEVETPALQASPGMERYMAAFETAFVPPAGAARRMYLQVSPEFAMKKLLVAGMERIWQLARAFRNGETSARHHPEFSMLEWYRTGAGWRDAAAEAAELVRALAGPSVSRGGGVCDLSGPWTWLTVAEAFREHAGIDLDGLTDDPERPSPDPLREAAAAAGVRVAADDGWEDVFFRVMLERVEPRLGRGTPAVLHSWPLPLAALARRDPADPSLAERFEIFVGGMELANGYGELADAAEHGRRVAETGRQRRRDGRAAWPEDGDLQRALEAGMPECAGVALGFDRLVMLATGAERIEDVLWAPVDAPRGRRATADPRPARTGRRGGRGGRPSGAATRRPPAGR